MAVFHLMIKQDLLRSNAKLGLSKAAFKRAVGRLLKDGLITITDNGILKK